MNCQDPRFNICQLDTCISTSIFPSDQYPDHTTKFISGDDCCNRRCHKDYYLCGDGEVGCLTDEDCAPEHVCNMIGGERLGFCEKLICIGQDNCCTIDKPCDIWGGDCDKDEECQVSFYQGIF